MLKIHLVLSSFKFTLKISTQNSTAIKETYPSKQKTTKKGQLRTPIIT